MGGIFGFVSSESNLDPELLAVSMAASMCHMPWYRVDQFTVPNRGIALGRVGIGVFNPQEQPVLGDNGRLAVFLEGELYNHQTAKVELENKGHRFQTDSDAECVLHLYEEEGDNFIDKLEGSFVLAIWDATAQALTIANDHYGLRPLYYAHYDHRFVFAPEVKAILKVPGCKRVLNKAAVAEFFRFQQLLGEKTFFEGVQLLPHASILKYDARTDTLTITPYWDFDQIEINTDISFDDAVIETARLFREALDRLTFGDHTYGVYLSGGLDSRMIAGFLARKHLPVHTATYGVRGSGDVISARKIAQKVGSQHHYYEFVNGNWVAEFAPLHAKLTECALSWMHSHGISTQDDLRQYMDVSLHAYAGDLLLGGSYLKREFVKATDELAFKQYMYHLYATEKGNVFWEEEERYFYHPDYLFEVKGLAYESFLAEIDRFAGYGSFDRQSEYFNILNRCMRMIVGFLVFGRLHFEDRVPFWDYRFFEFVYSLPSEYRLDRRLQLAVINRELPELALIPRQPINILPTDSRLRQKGYSLQKGLVRLINKQIQDFLPQWVPKLSTPLVEYCDYSGWLRRELRDWAEGIAFNDKTLQRGIFNPVYLRSIFDRHMSGVEDCTRRIAAITSFELMLREVLD
jgi:asparagine synthase (glutamine-hydrolysing)